MLFMLFILFTLVLYVRGSRVRSFLHPALGGERINLLRSAPTLFEANYLEVAWDHFLRYWWWKGSKCLDVRCKEK